MERLNLKCQMRLFKHVSNMGGFNQKQLILRSSVFSLHHFTQSNSIPPLFILSSNTVRFVEYQYGEATDRPFPYEKYQTVQDLCLAVIRSFSKSTLSLAKAGQRLGVSGRMRPPEAAFQDEFYRAYWNVVGSCGGICSEWAGTHNGRIDFLISKPGWGIELLLDGDRLTDHCKRFHSDGAYYQWITRGVMKDWIILDCRHSYPEATCNYYPLITPNTFRLN
jgi:hypothetical protein